MISSRLRAFISSKMEELAPERAAIREALHQLRINAWIFEKDAGARPQSIQETYLEELAAADLYIGVFWKGYGPYTIDEFEHAQALGMDCLIYEKLQDAKEQPHPALRAFLDRIGDVEQGLTADRFTTAAELGQKVADAVAAWQAGIVQGRSRHRRPAIYAGVPARPNHFVGRAELVEQMVRQLRSDEVRAVALEGQPGVGKTALAVVLANHRGVLRYFRAGVLWAGLGLNANPVRALSAWAKALNKDSSGLSGEGELAQVVRDAIGQQRMLLVIDDAWSKEAAEVMCCGGPNCCHLLTTRDKEIARAFATVAQARSLSTLQDDVAYQLLLQLAPEACAVDSGSVHGLAQAVGGLPLSLHLLGGYLAAPQRNLFPDLSEEALKALADPGRRLQLAQKRLGDVGGKVMTLEDMIALSLEGLPPPAVKAFYSLGAFAPKPEWFSREAAEAVTQASGDTLALLATRNLLEIDGERSRLTLHQTISDVARSKLDEAGGARHRDHYLALVNQDRYDFFPIGDSYAQSKRAWQTAPEQPPLLEWIWAMHPYHRWRGMWAQQLRWADRGLAVARNHNLRKEEGTLLASSAVDCHYLNHWDEAIERALRALPILEEVNDRAGCGRINHNLGMFYHALEHEEKAIEYFLRALPILEEAGDHSGFASCCRSLAFRYSALGRDLEAGLYYGQAESMEEQKSEPGPVLTGVEIAGDARSIQELHSRPDYLTVLHSVVLSDDEPSDLNGVIALGVQRESDGKYFYWRAAFASEKKPEAGYVDQEPLDADALLVLGEREAESILRKGKLPDVTKLLRFGGDRALMQRLISRYFSPKPKVELPPKDLADTLHLLGKGLSFSRQFSTAIKNFDRAIEIRARLVELGQKEIAGDLASSSYARGRALAALERYPESIQDLDKAIEIYTRLLEEEQQEEVASALANSLSYRGLVLTVCAPLATAISDYDKAIAIRTRLFEQQGAEDDVAEALADDLNSRAFLFDKTGKPREVVQDLDRAIPILAGLVEQAGKRGNSADLAESYHRRGKTLGLLERFPEALSDFERAVTVRTQLVEQEGRKDLTAALAESLESQAKVLPFLNRLDEAVVSFDKAIEIRTRLMEQEGQSGLMKDLANALSLRSQLLIWLSQPSDAIPGFDQAIDIYTRLVQQEGHEELTTRLAESLKFRGDAFESLGRFSEAIRDGRGSVEMYTRLVEQGGKNDLIPQLSASLNNLAYIYATCPEPELRDGARATEYATHACEWTKWSDSGMLDTLAAACAQAGDFDAAVRWEEKAMDGAPDEQKSEFRDALEGYRRRRLRAEDSR